MEGASQQRRRQLAANREIEETLRGVSKKEVDARRIEIECLELPGGGNDEYIVTVTPKTKENEPGVEHKGPSRSMEPIKRVFKSEEEVVEYLKKVI